MPVMLEARALAILEQLLDLPDGVREDAVDRLCDGDSALISRVRRLWALDRAAEAGQTDADPLAPPPCSEVPSAVGPYRIVRPLGQGGMGAVYLARRADGVYERDVAVKFVRAGLSGRAALHQFTAERRILAGLIHPNIAQLLDGGECDGQPYLVMEYVEGESIDAHATRQDVRIEDLLRLVKQVAAAVHFAHGRLIVHRDLKPGNILVTPDGQAKLLDFGIAKLYRDNESGLAAADSALTGAGLTPLTPEYASPEQLAGLPATPASDIYSLGVVLFELLTGRRPYALNGRSVPEALRVVSDGPITAPSQALSLPAPTDVPSSSLPRFAAARLRGDLDRIVLKAMHRDPQRRYASAAHFADDLARHLDGRPVLAHGDDWRYLTGKFVARHRLPLAAFAAAIVAIVVALVLTARLYVEAETARADAADRFEQLRSFAETMMFGVYDELETLPGSTRARLLLAETSQRYLDALAAVPDASPELRLQAGRGFQRLADTLGGPNMGSLGLRRQMHANLDRSEALLDALHAANPDDVEVSLALVRLWIQRCTVTLHTRTDIAGALDYADRADALIASLLDVQPELAPARLAQAESRIARAEVLSWDERSDEAVQLLDQATALLATLQVPGVLRHDYVRARGRAALIRADADYYRDRLDDAAAHAFASAAIYEAALVGDPWNLVYLRGRALAYWSAGGNLYELDRPQASLEALDQALDITRQLVAHDPDDTSMARFEVLVQAQRALTLAELGRGADAVDAMRWSVNAREQAQLAHPDDAGRLRDVAVGYVGMADLYNEMGDAANACSWAARAVEQLRRLDAHADLSEGDRALLDKMRERDAGCAA